MDISTLLSSLVQCLEEKGDDKISGYINEVCSYLEQMFETELQSNSDLYSPDLINSLIQFGKERRSILGDNSYFNLLYHLSKDINNQIELYNCNAIDFLQESILFYEDSVDTLVQIYSILFELSLTDSNDEERGPTLKEQIENNFETVCSLITKTFELRHHYSLHFEFIEITNSMLGNFAEYHQVRQLLIDSNILLDLYELLLNNRANTMSSNLYLFSSLIHGSPDNIHSIIKLGLIDLIFSALVTHIHDPLTIENGVLTLSYISNDIDDLSQLLLRDDTFQILFQILHEYSNEISIVNPLSNLLSKISKLSIPDNDHFSLSNILKSSDRILQSFQQHVEIIEYHIIILSNLPINFKCKDINDSINNSKGIINSLFQAIETFPYSHIVNTKSFSLLLYLLENHPENLLLYNTPQLLNIILQQFDLYYNVNNEELITSIITLLAQLSYENPENQTMIGKNRIGSFCTVVDSNFTCEKIVKEFCYLFCNLSEIPEFQSEIGKLGGINIILRIIERFYNNHDILLHSTSALGNLFHQHEANQNIFFQTIEENNNTESKFKCVLENNLNSEPIIESICAMFYMFVDSNNQRNNFLLNFENFFQKIVDLYPENENIQFFTSQILEL